MATKPKRRVSRGEWLMEALVALQREGVDGVRVERLARSLGTAKSGFYWHFRDRADLLEQMLEHWEEKYTRVVSRDPEIVRLAPEDRLRAVMQKVLEHDLTRYDLAIYAWGEHDPQVARRLARVIRVRMSFVGAAFRELGFEGNDLDLRTRLFVAYQGWERVTFPRTSKKRLRELIEPRLAVLLRR